MINMEETELEKALETMSDEQKEYTVFLTLYKMKNHEQRIKVNERFKEKGYNYPKAFLMAHLFSSNDNYEKYSSEITELMVVNQNYKVILQKTKQLSQELNLQNSLEIASLYTYLLWNGYFSENQSLTFQTSNRIMIDQHYSFDIMNGHGVCLNFSDMLTDFINDFDYSAATLINRLDVNYKRDYMPKIERKVGKDRLGSKILGKIMTPISNKVGNHAFTLIKENEQMYIYDPTNLMIFDIKDKFNCDNVCGTGSSKIKPYFSHFINKSGKAEETLVNFNMETIFRLPYDRKTFICTFEECFEKFSNNTYLLNRFYDDIHSNIESISNNVSNIKKLIK